MPTQTGGTITIKPNAIGDYGDGWGTNEGSGDKVAALDSANSADIYIAYEDGVQSVKLQEPVIPMGEAPIKIQVRFRHSSGQAENSHLVVKLILPSTEEYLESVYASTPTQKTDEWELFLSPGGNPFTQESLDELQVVLKSEGYPQPLSKAHDLWVVHWLEVEVFHDVA